jgi:hypothetical protein
MKQHLVVVNGKEGTVSRGESLNLTPESTLVVFEGPHRLFWSQSSWHFRLEGMWPNQDQRLQVADFMEADGRVIVIVDPSEKWAVPVLAEELPDQTDHLLIRWESSDLADVLVKPLDWLPFQVQLEAVRLLGHLHEQQANQKQLLFQPRPRAIKATTESGNVEIICLAPGTIISKDDLMELVEVKRTFYSEVAKVA